MFDVLGFGLVGSNKIYDGASVFDELFAAGVNCEFHVDSLRLPGRAVR